MTRSMADSVSFDSIPMATDIVAVYCSGSFGVVTPEQLEARFPNSRYGHVFIDVGGGRPDADVRDWENGDKAGSLEQWVIQHNHHTGLRNAVIYCDRSTIDEVRRLTGSQILAKDYWLWISTLDGTQYTGEGVIACQDRGANLTGGNWDESVVYDDNFWQATGSTSVATPTGSNPIVTTKPDCRQLQTALRTAVDGIWGPETDRHGLAVMGAVSSTFPYGVLFAQQVVDTRQDGMWGPASKAMLCETVTSIQNALNAMGFDTKGVDGIWGPNTYAAYNLARRACNA